MTTAGSPEIVKYNVDKSSVEKAFGYYPAGDGRNAWNPQAMGSIFKDNDHHDWDYGVYKNITEGEFNRVLDLADKLVFELLQNGSVNYWFKKV
jgi:hypothetical protein